MLDEWLSYESECQEEQEHAAQKSGNHNSGHCAPNERGEGK